MQKVLLALTFTLGIAVAWAEGQHSNPWLLSWIPAYGCVTNDCCWEIRADEVQSVGDDKWLVRATGQIRERTNWSPDGKYYRCACDYDNAGGKWVRHDKAHTRCIFTPMMSTEAATSLFALSIEGGKIDMAEGRRLKPEARLR